MRLIIAEKPSLARAIAEAIPGTHRRTKTHIECAGGDTIAWCAGHILETAPPEAYGAHYKSWRLADLPIAPRAWKLAASAPDLLQSIETLLRRASRVVRYAWHRATARASATSGGSGGFFRLNRL